MAMFQWRRMPYPKCCASEVDWIADYTVDICHGNHGADRLHTKEAKWAGGRPWILRSRWYTTAGVRFVEHFAKGSFCQMEEESENVMAGSPGLEKPM